MNKVIFTLSLVVLASAGFMQAADDASSAASSAVQGEYVDWTGGNGPQPVEGSDADSAASNGGYLSVVPAQADVTPAAPLTPQPAPKQHAGALSLPGRNASAPVTPARR